MNFLGCWMRRDVAPRVLQAVMRHRNISLTISTYTDARLLDTSEAVEPLSMSRNQPAKAESDCTRAANSRNFMSEDSTNETRKNGDQTTLRTLAPMLAPNSIQTCQKQSISDHFETSNTNEQNMKKPSKSLVNTGFSGVGDTELESVTSTMSTWRSNQLS
jgi:hypothetical protein